MILTTGSGRHRLKPTGAPVVLRPAADDGVPFWKAAFLLGLIAGILSISACSPQASIPTSPPPTLSIKPSPASSSTRTASPATPTQTTRPLPTVQACTHQPGHIIKLQITDERLPRSLPIRVYQPACLDGRRSERFPVLYLLHGLTYNDSQWDDLGVDETMDDLIAAGQVSPALIVMPWERTGIDLEQAIPQVLIPYVDSHFPTLARRSGRAIGGISRGGGWALRLGLLHPDLFVSVGLHSPAVIAPDLFTIPDWVSAIPAARMPRIWIDMGDHDTLRFDLAKLRDTLDSSGVGYEWHTYPGEHTSTYWAAHLSTYLRWYNRGW